MFFVKVARNLTPRTRELASPTFNTFASRLRRLGTLNRLGKLVPTATFNRGYVGFGPCLRCLSVRNGFEGLIRTATRWHAFGFVVLEMV